MKVIRREFCLILYSAATDFPRVSEEIPMEKETHKLESIPEHVVFKYMHV